MYFIWQNWSEKTMIDWVVFIIYKCIRARYVSAAFAAFHVEPKSWQGSKQERNRSKIKGFSRALIMSCVRKYLCCHSSTMRKKKDYMQNWHINYSNIYIEQDQFIISKDASTACTIYLTTLTCTFFLHTLI